MLNPTQRFSTRVDNYVKYRPSYPSAIIDLLEAECALTSDTVIADMGSGTGILAELFLQHGCQVFGIEPNDAMRAAGEHFLARYKRFASIAATAEATTLLDRSVAMITAGQAYHWFDREGARAEWQRILKPNGWVVLIWNNRHTGGTPFLEAYEQLLHIYGTDYNTVNQQLIDHIDDRRAFFGGDTWKLETFPNQQVFDWDGLRGRLLSSSYMPNEGEKGAKEMLRELQSIFKAHQRNGTVTFEYTTEVWYGQFASR
jgi:SAM-dependent methyltransferase